MNKHLLRALLPLALCAVPAAAPAQVNAQADIAAMRAATARFRDVRVALAEGYVADPGNGCHDSAGMGGDPALGGMGIHYFRPAQLGITAPPNPRVSGTGTHTDWSNPSILIYEPQADGSLELVAVENLVFQAGWTAAGHRAPPTISGRPWDRMQDDPATPVDEAHGFEPHFDQHVWIWRDNPRGMFEQFNPNVSCRHHRAQGAHAGHAGH
jgi:hypothetical protein